MRGGDERSGSLFSYVDLEARVAKCWNTITSGHVFQEMSLEDSKARCEVLDGMSDVLMSDGGKMDNFFMECVRKPKW